MKKRLIPMFFMLFTVFLLYYFLRTPASTKIIEVVNGNAAPEITGISSRRSVLKQKNESRPIYIQKYECGDLLNRYRNAEKNWRKELINNALDYFPDTNINQLLQVTALLEYPNVARTIRKNFEEDEKKISLSKQDQEIRQELLDTGLISEENLGNFLFSMRPEYWKKYFQLPLDEQSEYRQKISRLITTDSIVDILRSKQLSDDQTIELMKMLPDISAKQPHSSQNLLRAIIDHGNITILEAFISSSGSVLEQDTDVNILEYFIYRYPISSADMDMLSILTNHGLLVRASLERNLGRIQYREIENRKDYYSLGTYDTKYTNHFEDYKAYLVEKNVRIEERPTIESIKDDDETYELFERISNKKQRFIDAEMSNFPQEDIEFCLVVIEAAKSQIKRKDTAALLDDARDIHGDDKDSMREFINRKDPHAAECYINSNYRFNRVLFGKAKGIDEPLKLLSEGKTEESIRFFEEKNIEEYSKASYFWQAIEYENISPQQLIDSGITPQKVDFFWAASTSVGNFTSMADAGWPFDWTAPNGSGIVKYAASRCNIRLIQELHKRNYSYNISPYGIDPLAIGLNTHRCRSIDKRIALINTLMLFKPNIFDYHKEILAIKRHNKWEEYQALIEKHTSLKIGDDVTLVGNYYCSM